MTTETRAFYEVRPGRGGRMARQRKRNRCCGYCGVKTWRRSRGRWASHRTTLTRMAAHTFVAAELILATRPSTGEELESERLKAKLVRCWSSASCWKPRAAPWRRTAIWLGIDCGQEPDRLAHKQPSPTAWPTCAGLVSLARHSLPLSRLTPDRAAPASRFGRANRGCETAG